VVQITDFPLQKSRFNSSVIDEGLWWMQKVALAYEILRGFHCFPANYHSTNAPFLYLLSRTGEQHYFADTVPKNSVLAQSKIEEINLLKDELNLNI
jgi:hypothetical protein